MADAANAAHDTFLTGLRNQHAMEQSAIELLSRQVERLENYPEMEARMRRHIDESKNQAERLQDLLQGMGSSHSSLKDTFTSLTGNLAALGHTLAADEVLKNTFANLAFENFEIASYMSLLTLAEPAGAGHAMSALKLSLDEEIDMAEFIKSHVAPTTLTYVARLGAGVTAGV